jgi:hypothetical protein
MEEWVAPNLLDDPSRHGSHGEGPVRAGRPEGREAVRKGRQPNPGLPVTRLHLDPTVDRTAWLRGSSPQAHRLNWLRRRKGEALPKGKTALPPTFTKVPEPQVTKTDNP